MKKPQTLLTLSFLAFFFLNLGTLYAGSGYYLGTDYLQNSIKITINTSASGIAIDPEIQKTDTKNYGLRFGYRHKIHKYAYISPEFFYQEIDKSYLYSTTMKAGLAIKDFSLFGSIGYSEISEFKNSSENYGIGLEYKISDNFSISGEYIKFANVTTTDKAQFITVNKLNELETIKFGITYYFHE